MLIIIWLKRAIIVHPVFLRILVDVGNDISVEMGQADQRWLRIAGLFFGCTGIFPSYWVYKRFYSKNIRQIQLRLVYYIAKRYAIHCYYYYLFIKHPKMPYGNERHPAISQYQIWNCESLYSFKRIGDSQDIGILIDHKL